MAGVWGARHDDEVSASDMVVERLGRIQLVDASRRLRDAGIDTDYTHAEMGTVRRGGAADATYADDQCRRLGQVHRARAALTALSPVAPQLFGDIRVQLAAEGEQEGHDMDADVVVVDAAHVGHCDRAGHELWKIETGGRSRGRTGQPFELRSSGQHLRIQRAEGAAGLRDGAQRLLSRGAYDDVDLGDGGANALGPLRRARACRG